MSLTNVLVYVMGLCFVGYAFTLRPTTAMHEIYVGILSGSGCIILAIGALIWVIEHPKI
jgi:hypothetical protein